MNCTIAQHHTGREISVADVPPAVGSRLATPLGSPATPILDQSPTRGHPAISWVTFAGMEKFGVADVAQLEAVRLSESLNGSA